MKKIKIVTSLAGTEKSYAQGQLILRIDKKELKLGDARVRIRTNIGEGAVANVQIDGNPRLYGATRQIPVKLKSVFVKSLPEEVKG